jgi:ketosteroid isomerase-like protein
MAGASSSVRVSRSWICSTTVDHHTDWSFGHSTGAVYRFGMHQELEERIRRLEDERSIGETLALYGHYADTGDHDGFVDLFTEDAVIELVGGTPSGAYGDHVSWEGRGQIREYIDDPTMHMKIEGRCMHLAALNLRIALDGDQATAHSHSLVLLREGGETSIYGAGLTQWAFRRTGDRWRIAHRVRTAIGTPQRSSST